MITSISFKVSSVIKYKDTTKVVFTPYDYERADGDKNKPTQVNYKFLQTLDCIENEIAVYPCGVLFYKKHNATTQFYGIKVKAGNRILEPEGTVDLVNIKVGDLYLFELK